MSQVLFADRRVLRLSFGQSCWQHWWQHYLARGSTGDGPGSDDDSDWKGAHLEERTGLDWKLELGLIQPQMAQKPVLQGRVGARALRVRSVS